MTLRGRLSSFLDLLLGSLRWHPTIPQQMTREYMLSLGKYEIQPNEQKNIVVIHTEDFKPERLLIPRSVGVHFKIIDILVDGKSPLKVKISPGIPAVMFAENMISTNIEFDMLLANRELKISILNTSPDKQVFIGSMLGHVYWINDNPKPSRSRLWPTIS